MTINKNEKGFTLIELMIVVAIIGILAAIAIPQFSNYRVKAFNSAAVSDLHTARLAEEALFADYQVYGSTALTGAAGSAAAVTGDSVKPVIAVLSGQEAPISISKNVTMFAETASSGAVAGIAAQHLNGDKVYYAQTDLSGNFTKTATPGTALAAKVTPSTDGSAPNGYTAM